MSPTTRWHHLHTDTPLDLHSPYESGWHAFCGWLWAEGETPYLDRANVPELTSKWLYLWMERHWVQFGLARLYLCWVSLRRHEHVEAIAGEDVHAPVAVGPVSTLMPRTACVLVGPRSLIIGAGAVLFWCGWSRVGVGRAAGAQHGRDFWGKQCGAPVGPPALRYRCVCVCKGSGRGRCLGFW